jgi:hypothetical protein
MVAVEAASTVEADITVGAVDFTVADITRPTAATTVAVWGDTTVET